MNTAVFLGETEPSVGGGHTFQENILSALLESNSNHNFFIFYFGFQKIKSNNKFTFVQLSKPFNRIKNKFLRKIIIKFFANFLLNRAIKSNKIDIIWFMSPTYLKVKIPFIFTVWDLAHRVYPYFPEVSFSGWTLDKREKLYSYELPRASYIITGTEAGKNEIKNFYGIPEERIKIIPFPTPSFAINAKCSGKDILRKYNISKDYLFYPAQFWPHKNHISILKALKTLKEKLFIDFDVVFTGSDKGNLSYIKQKTEELNLSKNVHFLDFVSVEVLRELYKNAFALVYPTYFGPDNMPPLEAFALGCPVIASKVSGAEEQLGDAAVLINPSKFDEITNAVLKLSKEIEYRNSLIEKGLKRSKCFTSGDYIDKFLEMLDEFQEIRSCWSIKEEYVEIRQ